MMEDEDNEVAFRPEAEESAPPTPITTVDMDVIIRGWEEKFAKLTECLREVQLAMERTGSDMCHVNQEARVQSQERTNRSCCASLVEESEKHSRNASTLVGETATISF